MSTVTVITPWLDHRELLDGYARTVEGADQVIVILNRGDSEPFADRGWIVHRPGKPLGFAASNNRGLAYATGDVIVYLNNDVDGEGLIDLIRRDVEDGGLYGPSIGRQTLAGVTVPYVEGWCVAATATTWGEVGPWDAERFPKPYWEDVELSLRAIGRGLGLRRTPWPVRHLGGTTTRTEPGAWDGFATQQAVVEELVREIVGAPA